MMVKKTSIIISKKSKKDLFYDYIADFRRKRNEKIIKKGIDSIGKR